MLLTEYVDKKSDVELKQEFKELDIVIIKFECFNCSDLTLQEAIAVELEKRGYQYQEYEREWTKE